MQGSNSHDALTGKKIALTGRFASMSQVEFAELIRQYGGEHVSSPSRHTAMLVVGQGGWPLERDGQPTANLQHARKLRSHGYEIEIVSEDALLDELGLVEQQATVKRRYTMSQLSRILKVPATRLRRWMRLGLIEPVETVHRLAYFEYQSVAGAKMIDDLVRSGLPAPQIRAGLQRLRRWLPDVDSPLDQLAAIESDGRLLVRLADGRVAEPTGQLQFDFDQSADDTTLTAEPTRTVDEWFLEAVELEDAGNLREAAAAYEKAVALEPHDPVLHFNLGNVLYALEDVPAAEVHFRRAVSIDSDYVEAWNNLGSILCERGHNEEAIAAFRRALAIVPQYADAHYNVAEVLTGLDRANEARPHWEMYLKLEGDSAWADEVRRKLADVPDFEPAGRIGGFDIES